MFNGFSARQVIIILVVSLAILMENIDGSIINIAIPAIANSLHTSILNLQFVVTSYLIALAIFIPISGWVADKFGAKVVLFSSLSAFLVFSLCCGLANSLESLIIFRFLQGVSGAFMVPVARLVMLKSFDKSNLVRVYMIMAMPVVFAPFLAPIIGGLLITYFDWRYIFFVNIPLGLFGLWAAYKFINNFKQETSRFNWYSFIFLGLFLSITSFFLDTVFNPLNIIIKLGLVVLAVIFLVIYLKIELNSSRPVINYNLFKSKIFKISFLSSGLMRCITGGRTFIMALFLQLTLGLDTLHAAYLIACFAAGIFMGRMTINKFLPIFGFKKMLVYANIGVFITSLLFCFITSSNAYTVTLLILNGWFSSIGYVLLNILCYDEVTTEDYAGAVSLVNTQQQLTLSIGVFASAAILHLFNHVFSNFSRGAFNSVFIFISLAVLLTQWFYKDLDSNSGHNLMKKKA